MTKALWTLVVAMIAILVLSLLPSSAFAQLVIGEPSPMPVRLPACDTPDQMRDIMDHGKKGMEALVARFNHYGERKDGQEPACGMVLTPILILTVLYTEQVGDEKITVFVFAAPGHAPMVGMTTLTVGFSGERI